MNQDVMFTLFRMFSLAYGTWLDSRDVLVEKYRFGQCLLCQTALDCLFCSEHILPTSHLELCCLHYVIEYVQHTPQLADIEAAITCKTAHE